MLTDAGAQKLADKHGGAWKPYPNMVVGFYILKTDINSHGGLNPTGIFRGLAEYNGGPRPSVAAEQYAAQVLKSEGEWAAKLHRRGVQG
jgi:hypothetical protein